jgi:hypothetical protein
MLPKREILLAGPNVAYAGKCGSGLIAGTSWSAARLLSEDLLEQPVANSLILVCQRLLTVLTEAKAAAGKARIVAPCLRDEGPQASQTPRELLHKPVKATHGSGSA